MQGNGEQRPRDRILFLARAESRVRIVEYLREWGATSQRELRAELDVSRTTVSRSLHSLADEGWITTVDGEYRLTPAGEILATEFGGLLDTVETVEELDEFLRLFPPDVERPDLVGARDYEVTYATDADPYAPAREQSGILHTADRLRMLLPAIEIESTKSISEQVVERGLEVETVAAPDVETTMESAAFASLMTRMIRTGRSTVFVAEEEVPFYLGIADSGRVQIGLADDDGLPRALLETTDEDVREWAERTYRTYRDRATRKPLAEF